MESKITAADLEAFEELAAKLGAALEAGEILALDDLLCRYGEPLQRVLRTAHAARQG